MAPPLLETKLSVPGPRREKVARPRLIEQLNQGLKSKRTLVSASAGCGKTTLLAQWLVSDDARVRPSAVAYLVKLSSMHHIRQSHLPQLWSPLHVVLDVMLGLIVGVVLAFITAQVLMNAYVTRVNGWTTMFGCGEPGNGTLFKAACADKFPGVNVPQEAMYWTRSGDGAGHLLSGEHDYIMHFPAGQLPPNNAFWSLTMGDAQNHFVPNPISRYSVSDRSGLPPNADGSVDIYIQNAAPPGHESNWLPAPPGNFILWLRVYVPGAAVLDGEYRVPPVVEAR